MRSKTAMFDTLRARWLRFYGNVKGSVAVEGAVAMLFLVLFMLPVIDIGQYVAVRVELRQALRAGAQYAIKYPNATTQIEAAIIAAAPSLSLTIADVVFGAQVCECISGGAGVTTPCEGEAGYVTCSGGIEPGIYMPVTVTTIFNPQFISIESFTANMTVAESMEFRVG